MYPMPPAYTEAVKFSHRSVSIVEWATGFSQPWQPLEWVDGDAGCDSGSTCRWSANLKLPSLPDGLDNLGCRIRIQRGIHIPRVGDMLIPWGIHRVNDVEESTDGVSLSCSSYEKQVEDSRFLFARRVGGIPKGTSGAGNFALTVIPGMNYADVIQAIVLEAVPDASFDFRTQRVYRSLPSFIGERDRWSLLDGKDKSTSMAAALGVEMFFDGRGIFVVRDVPTLADQVVWDLDDEQHPVAVKKTHTQTRDSLYNVVSASGQTTTGKPPVGPAYAWDNEVTSRTYAGPDPVHNPELASSFGVIPVFLTSSFLENKADCKTAAQSYLQKVLGVKKTMSFDVSANYAAESGDVAQLDGSRYIIDSWSGSLTSSAMSCSTRSSKGDLSDLDVGEA